MGARDLNRPAQGTWLGITKQGRLALLTNFREDGEKIEERSRGEIAKSFLVLPPDSRETPRQFARRLVDEEGVQSVGGFSLIFGELRNDPTTGERGPLGVVSNRTPDADSVTWVAGAGSQTQAWTCALSNSLYGDEEWPKVRQAQTLLDEAIKESVRNRESEEQLLARFFRLLCTDKLPERRPDESIPEFMWHLRQSIFIPAFSVERASASGAVSAAEQSAGARPRMYGTQKQTVILVGHDGNVTYVERTLFDDTARPTDTKSRDRRFDFRIEDWAS